MRYTKETTIYNEGAIGEIDANAKLAADHMEFSGGALKVGIKKQDGSMGAHTEIRANEYDIVNADGTTILKISAMSDSSGNFTDMEMAHDTYGYSAVMQSDAYADEGARARFGMKGPDGSFDGLCVYGDGTTQTTGPLEVFNSLSVDGKQVSLSGHKHTKGQVGFDGYVSDVTTTHETLSGYTIQPSGTTTSPGYYRTISKKPSSPGTGYEAIGIVGVYTNHYAAVMVGGYYIDSSGAVNVQLRNHGSSKYTDLKVDVIVLWRKRY